jgi:hypothetical protein
LQLYEKLSEYVTEQEKEELTGKLQATEDWLYEEGEDEIKSVYVAKLAELKKASSSLALPLFGFVVDARPFVYYASGGVYI